MEIINDILIIDEYFNPRKNEFKSYRFFKVFIHKNNPNKSYIKELLIPSIEIFGINIGTIYEYK